jgi:hypothetical protein
MSDRAWFYAAQGQQQGPFQEAQFRNLIARRTVTADTLVWTEGMAGWQRAGDIPGLVSGRSGPPAMPQSGGQQISAGGEYRAGGQYDAGDRYGEGGGPLSIDLGLWEFLGRGLLYIIGIALVIPAPWVATSLYRWMASRVRVPDRPNFAFNGQPMDIWYALAGIGVLAYVGLAGNLIHLACFLAQSFLSWMIVRWVAGNLSSNGQPLPIAFNGSALIFIGWQVLLVISAITIVGWAWVIAAQVRWICRNIGGTHREIVFNATGLEILWRTLVLVFACAFIIPIPWMMRWYTQWYVSQFELVERAA